ncbi:MAG TPA: NAD-dependent epimerase/dehydratase family protein [Anaerolineaceae bacterium]
MARYLISGAAGFIASRVAEMLLDAGHTIVGVDNLNDAYDVRMKQYRLDRLMPREGFSFQRLDISDRDGVAALAERGPFDAIFNLAARAGVRQSVANPWVYVATNLTGTLNLLELGRQTGVPKFILASTSSIYGLNAPLPTPETADSSRPLQPYAASKKAAEVMCHSYHHLYGLDVTIFRYFTVYGPAGRPDMIMFRLAQRITEGRAVHINGTGDQSRGFTYLDDIAAGTILGLKPVGYDIFNLGGHQVVSMNQLVAIIEQLVGRKANITHHEFHTADMLANCADITRARAGLGWEPRVTLEQGIPRMVNWYMENRAFASQIVTE